jgi:hypothetical membrane protein
VNRLGAWCGIAAPASFVGGWLVAGAAARDYSPVDDHISELARVGAPTRPLMTAALVGFGVLAPVWGLALGRALRAPEVSAAVTAAGLTTLGVAALPLGGPHGDGPHAVAAGLGYVAMALSPLLAAPHLEGRARVAAAAVGATCAALLAGTLLDDGAGALQRAGLGVVDAWFAAMAVRQLRQTRGR